MSATLDGQVRRGLGWSAVSSLLLRAGSLVTGIVLARLLAPEDFGVFAVALTVQAVLVTLADLGLSADLVRAEDPERRAPTVATLSLVSGALLTVLMIVTARPVAIALGSEAATPVIVVLACTLVLSGAGVVPYAQLQRRFEQKKLFAVDASAFLVSTAVVVALVLLGVGPMALALSRLVGQVVTTCLQFALARVRPRFGFDRQVAGSALRFGAPLALANMLSWALLNIDNVVVSRSLGVVALGFYVLAFNVSSWPMTAIGQAIRPVTLAAFSRQQDEDPGPGLGRATALTAAVAVPAGALLAVLAGPVVAVLYGERWAPSAAALAGLAAFGALRIVLDVLATFLIARGSVTAVLVLQVVWAVTLVPVMVLATARGGLAAAGWAHLAVALLVVLPGYLVAVRRAGASPWTVLGRLWPPLLAVVPAVLASGLLSARVEHPALALLLGGTVGLAVYALLIGRWALGWARTTPAGTDTSTGTGTADLPAPGPSGTAPVAVPASAAGSS
ncbi:oligosaccharide flippase family protein [Modestobacter sp. I12A-02628]|uniref:Oligosaccharide flippase family protein n=1 Tax=Goekera deserti TaxID=2497753 RepID=A0A7K3WGW7_9ACTN|nr:oligosaccharide flippase family protein [Goekera deserti]MPQ99437.1 oligosaccharide flippase family protein [Goekera deserti]NDI48924.1 oligosaccharide flippase family protein [Goekera deserti]NEL55606.1 oligosaccharide flippase family protein [Goekera deserti]